MFQRDLESWAHVKLVFAIWSRGRVRGSDSFASGEASPPRCIQHLSQT